MLKEEVFVKNRILVIALCLFLSPLACFSGSETTHRQKKSEERASDTQTESPAQKDTARSGVSMRVLWSVSGYVIPEGNAATEQQARALLFKPLDIGESWITFDGKTCHNVTFTRETVQARDFLKNRYGTTPAALNIPDEPVVVFKTDCNLQGFTEYLRLQDRQLLIQRDGVFYYLQPAVNY
jgi:hypothetical protein